MAALTAGRGDRTGGRAELFGPAWGPWRGVWESKLRLVGRHAGWVLEEGGREASRWASLSAALRDVWSQRSVRDATPWALGWLGYEACADFAGGLPVRQERAAVPAGALLVEPQLSEADESGAGARPHDGGAGTWSLGDAAYRTAVDVVRERIAAGDVYQVNLSRRMTIRGWSGGLDGFMQASCVGGVPDYLARFDFGDGELLTASMELLLRRRGAELETRPIKGTRRRGRTTVEDVDLAAELDADPKERAELAMIVDLERNDLGRVCEAGSVSVPDAGSVRTYPAVHHRAARVTGRMRRELEWWDVLAAVAPGGSVTGCPKMAAMELIAELEPVPRGPFTGAFGVICGNGDMEMALPIRSAWSVQGRVEFAAGCGIVWESDPVAEELESRIKVARWLELVEGGA